MPKIEKLRRKPAVPPNTLDSRLRYPELRALRTPGGPLYQNSSVQRVVSCVRAWTTAAVSSSHVARVRGALALFLFLALCSQAVSLTPAGWTHRERRRRTTTAGQRRRLVLLGKRRFGSCSAVRWSAYCRQPLWTSGGAGPHSHVHLSGSFSEHAQQTTEYRTVCTSTWSVSTRF